MKNFLIMMAVKSVSFQEIPACTFVRNEADMICVGASEGYTAQLRIKIFQHALLHTSNRIVIYKATSKLIRRP